MKHLLIATFLLSACSVITDRDNRWMDKTHPVGAFVGTVEESLFRRGFRRDRDYRIVLRRLTHGPEELSAPIRSIKGNPVGETECWSQHERLLKGGDVRVICFASVDGRTTWHQGFDLGRLPGGIVQ